MPNFRAAFVGCWLTAALCLPAPVLAQVPVSSTHAVTGSSDVCNSLLRGSEDAIRRQDFSAAIKSASNARDVCDDPQPALYLLSNAQMLSKEFAPALQSANALLGMDPENMGALILKGQILYLMDQDADAKQAFLRAISVDAKAPEPHYWLGRMLYVDGHQEQAIVEFKQAVQNDAGYYRAYDGLGLAYESLGDSGHAVENFLLAIKLTHAQHPHYSDAYADLAELLIHDRKNQEAFDLAAAAASRNPTEPRNFYLAGKACEQAGQYQASLRWLKRAMAMDATYALPHYISGIDYQRLGNRKAADTQFNVFKKLEAQSPQVPR